CLFLRFFPHAPPSTLYTPSLHDALPISSASSAPASSAKVRFHEPQATPSQSSTRVRCGAERARRVLLWRALQKCCFTSPRQHLRSEEHTSELQSRFDLVCRLLLEKKNIS